MYETMDWTEKNEFRELGALRQYENVTIVEGQEKKRM